MSILTLFGSFGTLICCVLPAVIATIAGGAAVASLLTIFPWIVPLSLYKGWIFLGAGLLISIDALLILLPKSKSTCDLKGGLGCEIASKFSRIALYISIVIYLIGAFFSYGLVPILKLIDG